MLNPSKLASLPHVRGFHVEGEGHSLTARFDLTTGGSVTHFLPPALPPTLCPLPFDLGAVFVEDLEAPHALAYRVRAKLCAPLARVLSLRRVSA